MANDLRLSDLLSAIGRATAPLRQINRSSQATARNLRAARERLRDLDTQQQDIAGWRTQFKQAQQTSQALQQAQAQVRAVARQMKAAGTPTQAMTQQMRNAVEQARRLSQAHRTQSDALQQTRARLEAAGIQTRNLVNHQRDLRAKIAAANDLIANQTQRLRELRAQAERTAGARATLANTQQLGANLATTGANAMGSGRAALQAGARFMQPGLTLDAAMSKVQALLKLDKGDTSQRALRTQARELGVDTRFTASEVAQGQIFLAQSGFDAGGIHQAMPGLLDLAGAGYGGVSETADMASNLLRGMQLGAEHMGRLGDVMVGASVGSDVSLKALGETLRSVGPAAFRSGQDLETVAAMAGMLGPESLRGREGSDALASIFDRLSTPPAETAKALRTLGIDAKDAEGHLRDVPTVLQEIYEKIRHLGISEGEGVLQAIAGDQSLTVINKLVAKAGTGELQQFIQTLKQAQGEAQRMAAAISDNLAGDLIKLISAWEDLGIELQTQQDGPLRRMVQTLSDLIRSLQQWAAENPRLAASLVKTAAIFAALIAGMGALSIALASVLGPFALMRYALVMLGIRSNGLSPTLGTLIALGTGLGKVLRIVGKGMWALAANPVVAVLAALAAVAYLVYKNWDWVKSTFLEFWSGFSGWASTAIDAATAAILEYQPAALLHEAFAAAYEYLATLPTTFTDYGAMIVDGLVTGLLSGLGKVRDAIGELGSGTIDWFKDKLDIHSPSRVFAELGGFTTQGLAQGLEAGAAEPLTAMSRLSLRLVQADELRPAPARPGVEVGLARITFDERAPLSARATTGHSSNDRYEINIHPAPGTDARAIASAVRAELARIEADKAARRRSRLTDLE